MGDIRCISGGGISRKRSVQHHRYRKPRSREDFFFPSRSISISVPSFLHHASYRIVFQCIIHKLPLTVEHTNPRNPRSMRMLCIPTSSRFNACRTMRALHFLCTRFYALASPLEIAILGLTHRKHRCIPFIRSIARLSRTHRRIFSASCNLIINAVALSVRLSLFHSTSFAMQLAASLEMVSRVKEKE